MAALILRITPRHGRGGEHRRIEGESISIGRAFHNDVILADPFVGAAQFRVLRAGDALTLEVLDRTNPVTLNGRLREESLLSVASGDEIAIGHTLLTVLREDTVVAPTRHLPLAWWARVGPWRPVAAVLALLAVGAVNAWSDYTDMFAKPQWRALAAGSLTLVGVVLGWATLWAIVGRANRHQAQFAGHLALACAIVLASFGFDTLIVYGAYAADAVEVIGIGNWLNAMLLLFLLLYGEFRLATHLRRPALMAVLAVVIPFSLLATFEWAGRKDFEPGPDTVMLLRPPFAKLAPGHTLEDYDALLGELFAAARAD